MKKAGEIIKETRIRKNISLEEISSELRIHKKFLEAIEESRYEVFSDAVQIKGFLKNYSKFLGLNENEILAFWRREYKEDDTETAKEIKKALKPVFSPKLIITPKFLAVFATLAGLISFSVYLSIQYRSFAQAPLLEIESPAKDISIDEQYLDVFGKVDKEAELFLNGQQISINQNGSFALRVSLSNGVNVLKFKAANKLGREAVAERTILVSDKSKPIAENVLSAQDAPKEEKEKITVTVEIINSASWISIKADEKDVFPNNLLLNGAKSTVEAINSITVRAGNAGAVKIYFNGNDLGLLGKENEVVEKTFTKN